MQPDQFTISVIVSILSILSAVWWLGRKIGEKSDYIVRQVERIESRQYHQLAGTPAAAAEEES